MASYLTIWPMPNQRISVTPPASNSSGKQFAPCRNRGASQYFDEAPVS